MIKKAKNQFIIRFKDKTHTPLERLENDDINFDIHNIKQPILLRQFSEAIVRIAYLKYYSYDIPLFVKLKMLIENCIKTNVLFKKSQRRRDSQITDSSLNQTVVLDTKAKSSDPSLELFIIGYENELKPMFKELYIKSTNNPKYHDMTITNRFLYDKVLTKCKDITQFLDKFKYVEIINMNHSNKMMISDENKYSKEIFAYCENLLDNEMIFYEFVETIHFISRKFLTIHGLGENRDNYFEIIKVIEEQIRKVDTLNMNQKNHYVFPRLTNHNTFDALIEAKKQRDLEDLKKVKENQRSIFERKMLALEDVNVLPDENEHIEEEEEEESEDFSDFR
jgi:hypothetical protein